MDTAVASGLKVDEVVERTGVRLWFGARPLVEVIGVRHFFESPSQIREEAGRRVPNGGELIIVEEDDEEFAHALDLDPFDLP